MDVKVLEEALFDNIGNMTFEEAYIRTGRILNIVLQTEGNHNAPRLLNYLNAPNVVGSSSLPFCLLMPTSSQPLPSFQVIWSAACASCSVTGLYERVNLIAKNPNGDLLNWNPEGMKWTSNVREQFACFLFSLLSLSKTKPSF